MFKTVTDAQIYVKWINVDLSLQMEGNWLFQEGEGGKWTEFPQTELICISTDKDDSAIALCYLQFIEL